MRAGGAAMRQVARHERACFAAPHPRRPRGTPRRRRRAAHTPPMPSALARPRRRRAHLTQTRAGPGADVAGSWYGCGPVRARMWLTHVPPERAPDPALRVAVPIGVRLGQRRRRCRRRPERERVARAHVADAHHALREAEGVLLPF
jgi:hypothetical protein